MTATPLVHRVVTATEARRRFLALLKEAQAGVVFTITLRGIPVAEFGPIGFSAHH